MKLFTSQLPTLLLLLGGALVNAEAKNSTRSRISQASLDDCVRASNCELYDAPWGGKGTRFKKGMEPGTAHYNETQARARSGGSLIARAQEKTNIEAGSTTINYGAINPYDVIATLWSPCQRFSCNKTPYKVSTAYVVQETNGGYWGTTKWDTELTLHADGGYDGWDQRAALMKVMLQLSQTRQSWQEKSWEQWQWISTANGGYGRINSKGSQWEGTHTDWYYVAHYNTNGDMRDSMSLWFDVPTGSRGDMGCGQVGSVVKDVIGILSGPLATIFGALVGIACGEKVAG